MRLLVLTRYLLALICFLPLLATAAKPVFLITPVSGKKTPSTIYAGQTLTATYQVTNNTPFALNGNGVRLVPGLTQGKNTCGSTFNLQPGASCLLTLNINADRMKGAIKGGPVICNTLANPVYCSQPTAENSLNISPDKQIQKIIDQYLRTTGRAEFVSGIAVSVFIPEAKKSLRGDISSYFTGKTSFDTTAVPVTQNNLFEIGSITKSFASAIILQLEAEGLLSLNDTVGMFLGAQYPNWQNVTIKELLNTTSGIPSYTRNLSFLEIFFNQFHYIWTDTELLEYASPNLPIPPNRPNLWDYSNSNYIVSALIIEAVTQDTFAHQLQQRIVKPYHFDNLFYPAGPNGEAIQQRLLPRMMHGYFFDEDTKKLIDFTGHSLSWAGAAGAIVANTHDVARWVQLLFNGQIFDQQHRAQTLTELKSMVSVTTGQPLSAVTPANPTGFGLAVGSKYYSQINNSFWIYEGSTNSFRVMYMWSACSNLTIVAALNSKGGEGGLSGFGDGITDLDIELYKAILTTYPEYNCRN